jgi:thioredoxin 1
MPLISVTDSNFETDVIQSPAPVLVDFWAEWCGPCKALAPTLEKIAEERTDLKIVKLDVDANKALAEKFHIKALPTIMMFRDGKPVDMFMGARSKQNIEKWIDETLKMDIATAPTIEDMGKKAQTQKSKAFLIVAAPALAIAVGMAAAPLIGGVLLATTATSPLFITAGIGAVCLYTARIGKQAWSFATFVKKSKQPITEVKADKENAPKKKKTTIGIKELFGKIGVSGVHAAFNLGTGIGLLSGLGAMTGVTKAAAIVCGTWMALAGGIGVLVVGTLVGGLGTAFVLTNKTKGSDPEKTPTENPAPAPAPKQDNAQKAADFNAAAAKTADQKEEVVKKPPAAPKAPGA